MEGVLFKWGSSGVQVGFRSPLACPSRNVVLIGGLTDGLLPVPYTVPLARALEAQGWGLVQTLLSSSYTGYGIRSLDQDAEEMDTLLGFLAKELHVSKVVLVGHSTGCQDIVHYMGKAGTEHRGLVKGAVLQGPASDREYMASLPETEKWLALARGLAAEGRGQELMPRAANGHAPITAQRYLSLGDKGGQDDLFSSDLSNDELASRLGHMAGTPSLVLFSAEDEYVPAHVDRKALVHRLCQGLGGAMGVMVDGGDHSLNTGQDVAIAAVTTFLEGVSL